jgi:2-C-methyl-D-erythritol 4-phosphate cytidylyltransferase
LTLPETISKIINVLDNFIGAVAIFPSADAIITFDKEKIIQKIPEKSFLGRGQSPEGFRYNIIKKAHCLAREEGLTDIPDNCSLILKYKLGNMCVVKGEHDNLKITYPWDIDTINEFFKKNKG